MSAADLVPRSEPISARAGLTWQWRREDLSSYPASSWTLKYRFRGASAGFTFDATADGDAHAVLVAASTTSDFSAGAYSGIGWVKSGAIEIEVWRGTIVVLPSLTSGDGRSHVRRVIDAIEAVLENRATSTDKEYEIDTGTGRRRVSRIPHAELIQLRESYKRYEAQEMAAERVQSGMSSGRKVITRFSRPL